MRVNRIALAITVCAGVALLAGRASAGGLVGPLAEGFYDINNDPNAPALNNCFVGTDTDGNAGFFEAGGRITGVGTGGQAITITYDTLQPTSASRSAKKISVKQSQSSTIQATGGLPGAFNHGPLIITKCSISGSVNTSNLTGKVSFSCSGDDLFSQLTANEAASIETAFSGAKNVNFKFNANNGKASLKVKCSGDAVLE